jgi:hypothetical protein
MRIVLQNNVTSLYFCQRHDPWTPRFREAQDFGRIQAAIEFAQQEQILDVQVVVVLEKEGGLEFVPVQIQPPVLSAGSASLGERDRQWRP